MLILLAKTLNKNHRIDVFIVCILLMINKKYLSMVFKLILKLDILSFNIFNIALISLLFIS